MKPRRDEKGPRQADPASRLRSEPLNKPPSSRLRSDPQGKALVPDRVKAGPSWKKAAAKAGESEQAAQAVDPERPTPAKAPERAVPLADTTEEQAPARPQGSVPVVEAPAGAPKWKARAAVTAGVTSGQLVPKATPELSKATGRVEKRGGKLEKAQGKLARQKPPKRPGPVKRTAGFAGRTLHGYVHGKVYEAEHENVGLEGAHRVELAGEVLGRHGVRTVKRKVRQHPAKAVQRAESRYAKAKAEQVFQQARLDHPDLKRDKGPLARLWRKRRLKKQYQKQAQQAAKKTAQETASVTEKLGRAVGGFIKRHPAGCGLALLIVLLLLVLQSCMSSVTVVGNGVVGGMGGSTHPAEETDLTGAEAAYVALEAQLQDYLDNYTSTHSYDEYHFDLDEIEHDPYVLLAILSAFHDGEWTLADVQGELQTIFDRQYILTENVVRETRYRRETYTGEDGTPHTRRVPYSYYICTVTLENANLSHLPVYMMSTDQLSRYALYMASLGNRPDLFPTSQYVDKYITNPPAPHEVPEAYLADPTFAAMLAEAEKYLGYPYVWGGSSPATSFDCSGFVSWVANQCGWDIGRLGATGLYNICTAVTTPKPGDIVFFAGTFDAEGVTHCGIYVGDGWMLHCGDPIQYADLNTSYWQAHFYAYGRLP